MWKVGAELVRQSGWSGLMRGAGERAVCGGSACAACSSPRTKQAKSVLYQAYNHRAKEERHPHYFLNGAA